MWSQTVRRRENSIEYKYQCLGKTGFLGGSTSGFRFEFFVPENESLYQNLQYPLPVWRRLIQPSPVNPRRGLYRVTYFFRRYFDYDTASGLFQ